MSIPVYSHVTAATYFAPAGVALWKFRKLSAPMRVLAILTVLACVQLGVELIATYFNKYNNFTSDYYEFIEFCLISVIYLMVVKRRNSRFLLVFFCVVYLVIWAIHIPKLYNPAVVASDISVFSRIFLVAMSLVSLQSLMEVGTTRLVDASVFWVIFGVIVCSAGTLMVVGLGDQILKLGRTYFAAVWHINWSLNIAANLFYTKAFLCKQQVLEVTTSGKPREFKN